MKRVVEGEPVSPSKMPAVATPCSSHTAVAVHSVAWCHLSG